MPSAILLRKTQLALLQEKIIPDIQRNGARRLAAMRLPLELPEGMTARELSHPPLKIAEGKKVYPEGIVWDDVQMQIAPNYSLSCVVEGEVDILMGVTTDMASQFSPRKKQCGGYVISLSAPSYILSPPYIPRKRGQLPWERKEPHVGISRIFLVRMLPVGALCRIATLTDSTYEVQYSLLINDSQLLPIAKVLLDELGHRDVDPQIAQAQLLSLMLRVQRGMSAQIPQMIDGLYSRFPDNAPANIDSQLPEHHLIQTLHKYIKLHLHEPLTPSILANLLRLSPRQLNRILQKHTGLSAMEYVLHLRMEVAQLLLKNSSQSIQEIAQLVGYSQLPHFSNTFRHHIGISPMQFRHQQEILPHYVLEMQERPLFEKSTFVK